MIVKRPNPLLNNLSLKLVSLLIALVLWGRVVGSESSEGHYRVELELVNIPRELALVGSVPRHVVVRLAGPRGVLMGLDEKRLFYALDLSTMQPGVSTFEVVPSRMGLPSGVEVTQVSPSSISLEADKRTKKRVPVRARLAGAPAPGFAVITATVDPPIVELEGPDRVLKATKDVPTEVVDISGLAGNFDRNVELIPTEQSLYPTGKNSVRLTLKVREPTPEKGTMDSTHQMQ